MTTEQWERENQDTLMEYFIDGDPSVHRIQCECCRCNTVCGDDHQG